MGFDPETIAKLPADVNNKYSEESRKRYAR